MLKKLIWDSKFFNFDIFTIDFNNFEISYLDNEIKKLKNSLIQVKIDLQKQEIINKLLNFGFKLESISSTFQKKKIETGYSNYRFANTNDLKELKIISKNLFTKTRIKDHYFGKNSAHKLYNKWIEESINGSFDDCCLLITGEKNLIIGFVTLKKNINSIKIGLFGIAKYYQNKGFGSKLLKVVDNFKKYHNIKISSITTQNDNLAAKQLFIKNGYKLIENQAWFYFKN